MAREIPVNLIETGGKLVMPGALPQPPRVAPPPDPGPAPQPQVQQQAPPAPDKPAEEIHVCKNCGWPHTVDPMEPTRDEEIEFIQSLVLGTLFHRDLSLFDDAVAVRYRVLTSDEEEAVKAVIATEIALGKFQVPPHLLPMVVAERYTDLRIGLAVESLRIGKAMYQPAMPANPFKIDLDARGAELRAAAKTNPVYQAVRWQYTKFHAVCGTIQTRALKPSFPTATASSGRSSDPASPAA